MCVCSLEQCACMTHHQTTRGFLSMLMCDRLQSGSVALYKSFFKAQEQFSTIIPKDEAGFCRHRKALYSS